MGGKARAAALTAEQRSEIARKGGVAKALAKLPKATHRGSFQKEFGIDVDCYVLDDEQKTGVISKRGMGAALGMGESGSVFSYFIQGEKLASFVGSELAEKIANPLIFQWIGAGAKSVGAKVAGAAGTPAHGYDVTILIDVCKVLIAANAAKVLQTRHQHIVKQAHVILTASAKAGIKNLVYALAGYDATKQQIIEAYKFYVRDEAREYEKEFPDQLYEQWYRLYELPKPEKNKPWKFKALTIGHVYKPLANSNGKVLELTRAQRKGAKAEDRQKKLHQFLSDIGVKALRTHLGMLVGLALASDNADVYERHVEKHFGVQLQWDF
ncbi:MAG: P63C domain-containing protein [Myxococcota bacterium]|nr:P63C domain-containing protein [Myxococcota bacterium]